MDEDWRQYKRISWAGYMHNRGAFFSSSFSPYPFVSFFELIDFDLRRRYVKKAIEAFRSRHVRSLTCFHPNPWQGTEDYWKKGGGQPNRRSEEIFHRLSHIIRTALPFF